MSPEKRLKRGRDNWREKAIDRAVTLRNNKKELVRVKKECDSFKKTLKEMRARVVALESQSRVVVVQSKVDLVLLALLLFVVAHIGFRAVSRVLGAVVGILGIKKVPCPQTLINGVIRLSLVRIRSAPMLDGLSMANGSSCNERIWMIDMSSGLGPGKILAVHRKPFRMVETATIAMTLFILFINNCSPHCNFPWDMAGTYIARIYEPIFVTLLFYVMRATQALWNRNPKSVKTGLLLAVVVATISGNAVISLGQAFNDQGRIS